MIKNLSELKGVSFTTLSDPPPSFSLSLNLYKVTGQFPWSSLRETDRGVSAELTVNPDKRTQCSCHGVCARNTLDTYVLMKLYP